jgi:threonine aldolase
MRFISAQLDAYLENGRWRANAERANGLAKKMAQGLKRVACAEIVYPVEANIVLVRLPDEMVARLRAAGAGFYDWAPSAAGSTLIRLVFSFATPERDIERFLDAVRA